MGKKKTYVPGEIVKGARDAEDALARFKEDKERFVRPIVGFPFSFMVLGMCANGDRLLTGTVDVPSSVKTSLRFSVCCARLASRTSTKRLHDRSIVFHKYPVG